MIRRSTIILLALIGVTAISACASPRPTFAGPGPTGTGVHAFPDLEARIPPQIGGQTLDRVSLRSDPALQDAKTLAVLERIGATPADLQLASASLAGLDVTIGALRIVGNDADESAAAFRAVDEADPNHRAVYGTDTVANKSVITRTLDGDVSYIYPVEDILFFVGGRDDLVIEVLNKLP